ncbi:MAG: carboxylesterase/lipase family protein [Candidatus Omnitrophota bacterium]
MKNSFLVFLLITILSCSAFAAEIEEAPVVWLDSGPISGKMEDGVREYLGIPYAAAPIGKLRWKIPRDVGQWKDVRKCTEFGPSCPQINPYNNLPKISEDCLYINVWTSAKSRSEKLPVMVWIHGGAWNFGSSAIKEYDGLNLAKKSVVMVSFNYRLGPFGFWAHPRLAMESSRNISGNYGFLDQIMALWWVQWNIDAFGGDPQNVTIFGESAGSANVTLLMVSPLAKGLFHRVIAQSGGPMVGLSYLIPKANGDMQEAIKMGETLAARLKCDKDKDVVAAMRRKSTAQILEAADFKMGLFDKGLFFAPVFDGWAIPSDPVAAYSSGEQQDVPVVIGSNKDEGTAFISASDLSAKKYKLFMDGRFGKNSKQAMEIFPAKKNEETGKALNKAITVSAFAEPARFVADSMKGKRSKAYLYQFTRVPNTADAKKAGAYHGLDVVYVLGNLNSAEGYDEKDAELSRLMMDCWINFAKAGDPNGPGLPGWPSYDRRADQNLEFGDSVKINDHLFEKECDFVENLRKER